MSECDTFRWIGQPLTSCDECSRPYWEHSYTWGAPSSAFPLEPLTKVPISLNEALALRRRSRPNREPDEILPVGFTRQFCRQIRSRMHPGRWSGWQTMNPPLNVDTREEAAEHYERARRSHEELHQTQYRYVTRLVSEWETIIPEGQLHEPLGKSIDDYNKVIAKDFNEGERARLDALKRTQ